MKSIISILICSFSLHFCNAQNLIPNADFEDHSPSCTSAISWISPTNGTPDYFNVCNGNVPVNFAGNEPAYSGNGYFGLIVKNSGSSTVEWREYIQAELNDTLVIGTTYYLSMYLSLSDDHSEFASDAIGALLSTIPVYQASNLRFTQSPQFLNQPGNFITNKSGWQKILMQFVADSAYTYITIGNFFDDANTAYISVIGGTWPRAYYYIDNVCLSINADGCSSIINVDELEKSSAVFFPNPFNEQLHINARDGVSYRVKIFNSLGEMVYMKTFTQSLAIDPQFAQGIYYYELLSESGVREVGKLIRE